MLLKRLKQQCLPLSGAVRKSWHSFKVGRNCWKTYFNVEENTPPYFHYPFKSYLHILMLQFIFKFNGMLSEEHASYHTSHTVKLALTVVIWSSSLCLNEFGELKSFNLKITISLWNEASFALRALSKTQSVEV